MVVLAVLESRDAMQGRRDLVRNEARANFRKDQAFRSWGARHGGVYVPPTEHTPPNPYLAHLPNRDVVTSTGMRLTLMNPAYMVRQMMEDYSGLYGVKGRITSAKPLRPENAPDAWERAALESFEHGTTEVDEFTTIDGEPYLRLMRPMKAEKTCLKCHGHQGYKEGDIRGGVGVSVPAAPFFTGARKEIFEHTSALAVIWLIGLGALVFGYRQVRRRVQERDRAVDALQESERKFRTVADHTRDWEGWIAPDGRLLYCSPSCERITEYTSEELSANPTLLTTMIHTDDRASASRHMPSSDERDHVSIDFRIVTRGGEIRWIAHECQPIINHDGCYLGRRFSNRDVTSRVRAEEALRESREILHAVLNSIPVRVFWKDKNLKYLGCNTQFARDAGFDKPEQLIGKDDYAMGWKEQAELYRADDRAVIETGATKLLFEEPQTTPDGELIHLLTSKVPLRDAAGEVVGVLGSYLDITDHKRAEQALQLRESYLSSIIENQPGLVWLKDRESRFLAVNKAFALASGRKDPTDLIGLTDLDIWPKELAEKYRNDDSDVMKTGTGKIIEELVHDQGQNKWFETFKTPVIGESGGVVGTTGYARDITERKLAVEAIRQSEERYLQLFSSVMEGIGVVDANEIIQYCNPAFADLFDAQSQDDLVGRCLTDLVPDDQRQTILSQTENRKKGHKTQYELEILSLKNNKRTIMASISPRFDAEGRYTGAFGAVMDITETRRLMELESRAKRLETAGRIAGQVAHDFNNMLAPIMAYPELIREQLPEGDPGIEYLNAIEESAQKIADLNQQLLTLSRRGHYNLDILSLNALVREVVRDTTPIPDSLVIETSLADDLMNIKGGAAQLHRVVMNLIVNARDALQDIGRISIRTENYYVDDTTTCYGRVPRGEYVKITITDTGCGIPDEIVQRIFDPFFTTKSTDRSRGSGLGLSVVDAVMKDHDGFIDLTTKIGSGTAFYLYFPITRSCLTQTASDEVPAGDETVLIVDDDEMQRDVSARLLTTLGYKVTACEGGTRAIELMQENSYDLLLLDMIMPDDIDGAETYRRALRIRSDQKAIIVSGFSESQRVIEAQSLGAGAFVRKPLSRKVIAIAVRRELDRTPALVHTH